MLSSRSFIILSFIFRSSINLSKFLFMLWSMGLTSFFCMWIFSCLNSVWWKGLFSFSKSWRFVGNHLTVELKVSLWTLKLILLTSESIRPVPHCFHFFSSVVSCEIEKCDSSFLFLFSFFFKIDLAIQHPLRFHMNLRIIFSTSVIKDTRVLILNLLITWRYCHLNSIKSSVMWTQMSLNSFSVLNFFQPCYVVFSVYVLHLFG